jgi:hypothetical protein
VPTPEERLARIEVRTSEIEARLEELLELVNSGPRVPWEQSLRGRLHTVSDRLASVRALEQAAREVRRARHHSLSVTERLLLALCAVAAAVAPYVLLLTR